MASPTNRPAISQAVARNAGHDTPATIRQTAQGSGFPAGKVNPCVMSRETVGDRDGDPTIFQRAWGKTSVASPVERKPRFTVLFPNYDRSSARFMRKADGRHATPAPTGPPVDCRRQRFRVPRMAQAETRHRHRGPVLRAAGSVAEGGGGEPRQTRAPIPAAQDRSDGAHKSLHEVDVCPPQRDAPPGPRPPNPDRGLQRRIDEPEMEETVATTLEPSRP
jgi:hypothetical protein